jgi:hypothetical protein
MVATVVIDYFFLKLRYVESICGLPAFILILINAAAGAELPCKGYASDGIKKNKHSARECIVYS